MLHPTLLDLARRQHALLTHLQVRRVLSAKQLEHRLDTGELEPVRIKVYRLGGAPESWEQSLHAACLARPGSVASFRAAAGLGRLNDFDRDLLELTVRGVNRARLADVVVHQSDVWGPGHVATKGGVPCTSVARTLCDLSAVVPEWMVERAVDDALRRKLVSLAGIRRVADALDRRGRRRATVVRRILSARTPGYHPGESDPEKGIAGLLVRAGLPRPVPQYRVRIGGRSYRVDLGYPDHGVVIEYDSWEHHRMRSAFDGDRARGNELEVLGLTVLRFTSKSTDATIVRTVADALDHRAPTVTRTPA